MVVFIPRYFIVFYLDVMSVYTSHECTLNTHGTTCIDYLSHVSKSLIPHVNCHLACDLYCVIRVLWSLMTLWVMFMHIQYLISEELTVRLKIPQNWHTRHCSKPPHRTCGNVTPSKSVQLLYGFYTRILERWHTCRQSAVNMLSCENTAVKRYKCSHSYCTLAPSVASCWVILFRWQV